MRRHILCLLVTAAFFAGTHPSAAQNRNLTGFILDKQGDEPIPFASVVFKNTNAAY